MQFEGLQRRRKTPSLTPLIDIVFLLLVFFMLTAHFIDDQSLDIALPEAESAMPLENQDSLEIVVDDHGQILLNKKPVSLLELDDALRLAMQGRSNKQVILRGDQATELGLMVKVMDAARKAGAESLDIMTRQP